ncbi:MAG: MMPL family transporter, partial [Candidatus Marinimicrobia bacterium]|nr:MMPL family transporter [Candidatus Neomarinimicrobiota bacterium]
MRDKVLIALARWHAEHPWRMLGIVAVITGLMAVFMSQLGISMQMEELLPEGDPRVDQYEVVRDEFATASNMVIVVQGEEDTMKKYANSIAPKLLELKDTTRSSQNEDKIAQLQRQIQNLESQKNNQKKISDLRQKLTNLQKKENFQFFQRVEYKAETEFLRNHGLLLTEVDDLESSGSLFTNPNLTQVLTNLNDSFEEEYGGDEESLSTREQEDEAIQLLGGIETFVETMDQAVRNGRISQESAHHAADQLIFGEPYLISYDNSTMIIEAIPNFTITDRDLIVTCNLAVQDLLDSELRSYPELEAGLTGSIAREYDEQVNAQESLQFTTILSFIAIFVMLIVAFRMWIAPVLAMLNLVVGLVWAMGLAYLARGELNMVTSMMSIILLGLGIDFSIHLISSFTEWRALGDEIKESLEKTFLKTGKGIMTGAFTTSIAFFTLIVSRSEGMESMGVVTGLGLLAILFVTFLFLPILLVFRERRKNTKERREQAGTFTSRDLSLNSLGRLGTWMSKHYIVTISITVVLSAFMLWSALNIKYEKNYLDIQPEGITSVALMDTIQKKFDLGMEYSLYIAPTIQNSRRYAEEFKGHSLVATVDNIGSYLPSTEEQEKRISHIKDIRNQMESSLIRQQVSAEEFEEIIDQIQRLEMNIIEMQDLAFIGGQERVERKAARLVGLPNQETPKNIIAQLLDIIDSNPEQAVKGFTSLQRQFAPRYKETVIAMAATEPILLDDLPTSILDRYSNRDRDKFLVSIYPKGNVLEDGDLLYNYVDGLDRIHPETTGAPQIGIATLRVFAEDGRNAVLLTLITVFILLWIDFRRPRRALIAMLPLLLGGIWMVGLMQLTGMKFQFINFIAIPLIIGIGIDDGVHLMHRWLSEGRSNLHTVFASTGKAILLTSITTMLAFGSMHFATMPIWRWFGDGLFLGVGACFVTSILGLSGVLGWIQSKKRS